MRLCSLNIRQLLSTESLRTKSLKEYFFWENTKALYMRKSIMFIVALWVWTFFFLQSFSHAESKLQLKYPTEFLQRVNGSENEVSFSIERKKLPQYIDFICISPTLPRWKIFHEYFDWSLFQLQLSFNEGFYISKLSVRWQCLLPLILTCEELVQTKYEDNPPVSLYVYGYSRDHTFTRPLGPFFIPRKFISVKINDQLCAKVSIPCRLAIPEAEVSLEGKVGNYVVPISYDTYSKHKGFEITLCSATAVEFYCRANGESEVYRWKAQPEYTKKDRVITPFRDYSFAVICIGDTSSIVIQPQYPEQWNLWSNQSVIVTPLFSPYIKTRYEARLNVKLSNINLPNWMGRIDGLDRQNISRLLKNPLLTFDCKYSTTRVSFALRLMDLEFQAENNTFVCYNYGKSEAMHMSFYGCLGSRICESIVDDLQDGTIELNIRSVMVALEKPESVKRKRIFPFGVVFCGQDSNINAFSYITGVDGTSLFWQNEAIPTSSIMEISLQGSPFYFGLETSTTILLKYSPYYLINFVVVYFSASNVFEKVRMPTVDLLDVFSHIKTTKGINKTPDLYMDSAFKAVVDFVTAKNMSNGEYDLPFSNYERHFPYNVYLYNFTPTRDLKTVIFSFPMLNETGWRNFSVDLDLQEGMSPEITNEKLEFVFHIGQAGLFAITCSANGNPPPEITWLNATLKTENRKGLFDISPKDTLRFPAILKEIEGIYICQAENTRHGLRVTKAFRISVFDKPFDWTWIGTIVAVATGFLCFFGLFVYHRKTQQQFENAFRDLTGNEVDVFFNGSHERIISKIDERNDAVETALRMPYNDMFEIEENSISFDSDCIIGEGTFGLVRKAMRAPSNRCVAVKTTKESTTTEAFKAILVELKIVMYVGYHPNIVEFFGAITTNIRSLEVKLVMEYCANGDLNCYLKKKLSQSTDPIEMFCVIHQFLKWMLGITSGMEHIEKKKIIHGDIAARNILLDANLIPKLGDFGLAVKSKDYNSYVKKGASEMLPWRWMALECLTQFSFSTASDVWAFGVTGWEIFSFGNVPFANQNWNEEFVEQLQKGLRLPKPEFCPDKIYEILRLCWTEDIKLRPNIQSIKDKLDKILNNSDL